MLLLKTLNFVAVDISLVFCTQ